MARGDHIYIWRRFGVIPFQHHAIDLGDGDVIHFSDGSGDVAGPSSDSSHFVVARMAISKLTRGGKDKIFRVDYVGPSESPDAIVERAISQLGRRGYHLFHDNCEHFASWCVTGKASSNQVTTAAERASSVALKTTIVVAARVAIKSARVIKPWTLAADAVQFGTELVGHRVGLANPKIRKNTGRALGGLTAIGIGAIGGPIGIAVAGGTWVLGELGGEVTSKALAHQQSIRASARNAVRVVSEAS